MFGFYRVAAAVPKMRVADVAFNVGEIAALAAKGASDGAAVMIFPELAVTGYTCADLFHNQALLDASEKAVAELALRLPGNTVYAIGTPVRYGSRLFNAAVVIQHARIVGIVPKSNLPNYREFYEKRYFSSGAAITGAAVDFAGTSQVPFGVDLIFSAGSEVKIGLELCEDLWAVIPPSSHLALAGATLLLNLSASNELVGKSEYRRALVAGQSARCVAAYAYTSSGVHESTTDVVCGGHAIIAENGALLLDSERFGRESVFHTADVDLGCIAGARLSYSPFGTSVDMESKPQIRVIELAPVPGVGEGEGQLRRVIDPHPFVPYDNAVRDTRCREIFAIQSAGLAKRVEHTHAKKLVIGISGGLDSTLALLVAVNTMKLLGRPATDVLAVTMPGFGTTDRTHDNAVGLCRELGVELREINIGAACIEHFNSIGHDINCHDVVYENSQARERTQILLDLANQEGGIAVGTGDLSELAMGWCTFNGDHISMYAVNTSVPKTLIRYVISWVGDHSTPAIGAILQDVIDTPVSPELLPAGEDGAIKQRTEDIIGPYEVHDFFIYHFLKYGASPDKLLYLAKSAFKNVYSDERLTNYLKTFLRRFFGQQFKRSCLPDGPKVGSISLSPRGDWRMPSDAASTVWFDAIQK